MIQIDKQIDLIRPNRLWRSFREVVGRWWGGG